MTDTAAAPMDMLTASYRAKLTRVGRHAAYIDCPRGVEGGQAAHQAMFLVHRIIPQGRDENGRPVWGFTCMDAQLSQRYDESLHAALTPLIVRL